MEKISPINLDTRTFGEAYPDLVRPVPEIRSDIGKINEVSDAEVEAGLPVWAVEANRREEEIALQSLHHAMQASRK